MVLRWCGSSQSLILMGFKQETRITDNDRDPLESIQPRSRRVKMDLCDAAL